MSRHNDFMALEIEFVSYNTAYGQLICNGGRKFADKRNHRKVIRIKYHMLISLHLSIVNILFKLLKTLAQILWMAGDLKWILSLGTRKMTPEECEYCMPKIHPSLPLVLLTYINEPGHNWFKWRLVACSAPRHFVSQHWLIVNGSLGTNFSEILIKIHNFLIAKMHLKMSSVK